MSWLNLNQSLSSLKGQITNFASEVLSEGSSEDTTSAAAIEHTYVKELEDKCRRLEADVDNLSKWKDSLAEEVKKLKNDSEKNGMRGDWFAEPQSSNFNQDLENQYKLQIKDLQDELSYLKNNAKETTDVRHNTDDELNRLREENQNLTTNLEDLDNQHQLAMERLLSLKKELQKNFEVLKQEHEELKSANEDYAVQTQNLLAKVNEKDTEIESLRTAKSDYETLYHKYQNLEKVHSLLRENAEKFQEENQELQEEVFQLQEHVTKQGHELEIAVMKAETIDSVPKDKYDELVRELNDLKNRRNSNHDHLDEVNIDDNAKSVIENLKRDLNELRHQLSQKDIENHDTDHRVVKSEKIMQLYNKYINFELPVDYVGEIPSPGDNIVMYKLESVFKTIHSFKKDIDSLEHQLSEKNLNVNHLHTQIDDLTTENDFLTTDIQHYERELNEMKKNNEFLISEIAALKNTSKLEPIIETHEDNLAKLETELADCNKMNKSFESEIKRIEKQLSEVRTEKIMLQESLNDLKSKYTTMLTELELCKSQGQEVEQLEHTASTEQAKLLKNKTDQIDDLRKKLHAAHTKNEQLSIDIHIIENDKVLLTKEVDELRNTLKEKSTEHKELEVLKIALDRKLEDLESKLDDVIKHKNEIEDKKLHLEEKIMILENQQLLSNKTEHKADSEKLQLSEKVNHTLEENLTLVKTIDNLTLELTQLKEDKKELMNEIETLKNENIACKKDNTLLQEINNELKAKAVQEEFLNNEILVIKEENQKLIQTKNQLESELSHTDSKIVNLEQEFDKLIADLNEKDVLIDNLNLTNTQNNVTLQKLNQSVTELENVVVNKDKEIDYLKKNLEECAHKLKETEVKINRTSEELNKLHKEKEEVTKQLYSLNDDLLHKNEKISSLTLSLEELQNASNNHTAMLNAKELEMEKLNQSQHDNELSVLKMKYEDLEKISSEYKSALEKSNTEKAELINLINLKHNESLQYHNEIQRLNHVLLEQTNEFKKILDEKDKLIHNKVESCTNCENVRMTLKEKDEIIINLTKTGGDNEILKAELASANDSIKVLTEKCDKLDKTLGIQLETVKKLTTENAQLSEQEQNSTRELDRLRHHLVEMEESYTQELMTSEQKLTECQTRLHQVEERAKQNSTVYTSNSIRANQEVETLRNQIKLLEKQREDVQVKLSEAEDARSRSEAALTNLQVVLEQFQLDKERDIHSATEKIRNKMDEFKRENRNLLDEIARLNCKLEESVAGLQAASRLGDQVETKTAQINDLKEQVKTLQTSIAASEERYYNAISNQQDKVDKNLVKNLVINYVITSAANNHNKTQVLRILSTVLDFNQQECEKLGLVRSSNATDSLAAEFVKFLQNESRPRPPLPNMMGLAQGGSRSSTPTSRKSSTIGPHPFEVGHKRNPSTGSNNLLFQNLDSVETSSQRSRESDQPRVVTQMDTGINQTRNTESAILKHVLKDM